METLDAVIVGGGHNGLVAATLLARGGWSVSVLERRERFGGAAVSARVFPNMDARLSRYSYLVSLFPASLRQALGLRVELRRRRISSYTPSGDGGILIDDATAPPDPGWEAWQARMSRLAGRLAPTLLEPLHSREQVRRLVDDPKTWRDVFEAPLSEAIERELSSDLVRGVVLTDGLIGTFASAAGSDLRQNRCFLYHVIGDGTGEWRVPVGGMGEITRQLLGAARASGAQLIAGAEATALATDERGTEVTCSDGARLRARHLLWAAAPAILYGLLPEAAAGDDGEKPEGSQLKVNMLLRRLPRLRDPKVAPSDAFAGTLHVNEGYAQLERSFGEASAGRLPELPPCEVYCHSLSDPTILSAGLRQSGAQTLTLFGLHMPARLFRADPAATKAAALEATLRSLNSVLAEPIEDCLWVDPEGEACLEAMTPLELESELAMPGGHIFHRDLQWPFAEAPGEEGRWGGETDLPNVWLAGAGARRGGGVSGIPGHNAARAVLTAGRGGRRTVSA